MSGRHTIEQKIEELLAAGWKMLRYDVWRAPTGGLYLGPTEAWKKMRRDAVTGGKREGAGA